MHINFSTKATMRNAHAIGEIAAVETLIGLYYYFIKMQNGKSGVIVKKDPGGLQIIREPPGLKT